MCVFCTFARFSPPPEDLFSRVRSTRGGACTPRRKFDSRTGSVARALGVRSREIWHVNMGALSAELRAGLAKNRFFTRPAVSPPFGNIATQS